MTTQEEYQARLDDAIALMRRVIDGHYNFDMDLWVRYPVGKRPNEYPEGEMYRCGMCACFGGWLGVSREFRDRGGYINSADDPFFGGFHGSEAIAEYFGWSDYFAKVFTATDYDCEDFYDVDNSSYITRELVLEKLLEIKAGKIDTNSEGYV